MQRTYKYRLYPTRRQKGLLLEQLRATRELYNAALEQRMTAYRQAGKSVSYLEQSKDLTVLSYTIFVDMKQGGLQARRAMRAR